MLIEPLGDFLYTSYSPTGVHRRTCYQEKKIKGEKQWKKEKALDPILDS